MGVRKVYNGNLQQSNVINLTGELNNIVQGDDSVVAIIEEYMRSNNVTNWEIKYAPGPSGDPDDEKLVFIKNNPW